MQSAVCACEEEHEQETKTGGLVCHSTGTSDFSRLLPNPPAGHSAAHILTRCPSGTNRSYADSTWAIYGFSEGNVSLFWARNAYLSWNYPIQYDVLYTGRRRELRGCLYFTLPHAPLLLLLRWRSCVSWSKRLTALRKLLLTDAFPRRHSQMSYWRGNYRLAVSGTMPSDRSA